jgi:two-component system cell cycle response regulator DivK
MEMQYRNALIGWTVVVVDDDPATRDIVQQTLERAGAEVHVASNGFSGFELIKEHRPHFVISDLDMRVCSGWQLLRFVQQDSELETLPIVAYSAHLGPADSQRAVEAGFSAYLHKPIMPSRFVKEVVHALALPAHNA